MYAIQVSERKYNLLDTFCQYHLEKVLSIKESFLKIVSVAFITKESTNLYSTYYKLTYNN